MRPINEFQLLDVSQANHHPPKAYLWGRPQPSRDSYAADNNLRLGGDARRRYGEEGGADLQGIAARG